MKIPHEHSEWGVICDAGYLPRGSLQNNPSFSAKQITPAACCGIFVLGWPNQARLSEDMLK